MCSSDLGEIADRLAAMEKAKREGAPYDYAQFEQRTLTPLPVNAPDVNKIKRVKKARENMAEYMREYRAKKRKD